MCVCVCVSVTAQPGGLVKPVSYELFYYDWLKGHRSTAAKDGIWRKHTKNIHENKNKKVKI